MKNQNRRAAFTLPETCMVIAIIGLLGLMCACAYYKETVVMPKAYNAWVKQTGNTNHVSFDEWRSLLQANEPQNNSTFIFVAH